MVDGLGTVRPYLRLDGVSGARRRSAPFRLGGGSLGGSRPSLLADLGQGGTGGDGHGGAAVPGTAQSRAAAVFSTPSG